MKNIHKVFFIIFILPAFIAAMELEKRGEQNLLEAILAGKVEKVHAYFNKEDDVDCAKEANKTPLMFACIGKHVSMVRYLLERYADPTKVDSYGNTPLHYALADKESDKSKVYVIVDFLLQAGAHVSINQLNKDGKTPLKLAQINDFDAAEQLMYNYLR